MAEKSAPRKRSTASAKQQMLETLSEVTPQVEQRTAATAKPEERIEQRSTGEAVATADALSTDGVVKSIGELRAGVGKMLAQLSDRLEEEVSKYVQVKRAILAKEQELKDIYEIQKSASTLTALIESHQRKQDEFEREMEADREQLQREIIEMREKWIEEKKEHEAELKERDAAETKRREREREEYRYTFTREQQLAKDQFADEMAKAQRELSEKRAQMEKDLTERQRTIESREQELSELRHKVEAFDSQLSSAVAKAVADATAKAQADAASREELLKKEFAGEKNVLTTQLKSLDQTVKEQSAQILKFSQQAEKAYSQVQDIAVKAIEGSSNFKSLQSLQQLLTEQGRKQGQEK